MQMKNILIIAAAFIIAICAAVATTVYVVQSTKPTTVVATQPPANNSFLTINPTAAAGNVSDAQPQQLEADRMAQIITVKPHYVYHKIPYTSCHQQQRVIVRQDNTPPIAGAVLGGVAGGVLGHQIGHGRGKDVATVVGAVGGAVAGGAMEQSMRGPNEQTVVDNVCVDKVRTVRERRGYEVTFIYKGVQDTLILQNKPIGDQIPIEMLQTAAEI